MESYFEDFNKIFRVSKVFGKFSYKKSNKANCEMLIYTVDINFTGARLMGATHEDLRRNQPDSYREKMKMEDVLLDLAPGMMSG